MAAKTSGDGGGRVAPAASAAPRRRRTRLTSRDAPEARFPEIYRRLDGEYPGAKCALNFAKPHEMLFATVLSAQCTDATVNKVTAELFRTYRTLEDYASADRQELERDVRPTGFFRMKAKHLQESARLILDEFGGDVPATMEGLLRLPGVARKTANIVLGNAFGIVEGVAVDTHVRRLSQRLGLTVKQDPDKIERDLMAIVPKDRWFRLTYLLIEHGRRVCRAPVPRCEECVLSDLCPSSRV